VFPPFATPSYSNAAFAILGLVVEAVTKKDFASALEANLLKPLNLTRTSLRPPSDRVNNNAVLHNATWLWEFGVENP
jgi:CubicO group peptidase (beta-lactamase class C family)